MRQKSRELTYHTGQIMQVTLLTALFLLLLALDVHPTAATATLITALLHQGLVVIVWRRVLFHPLDDEARRRRVVWTFGFFFFLLFSSRLYITIAASRWHAGSLGWSTWIRYPVILTILVLSLWTLYSVFRYFGVYRALGADHFDPYYRKLPFERRGIYRYTSNGMYTFATLLFLLPGLLLNAYDGLLIGLYHYGATWVHYHATEKPDLLYMHGEKEDLTKF